MLISLLQKCTERLKQWATPLLTEKQPDLRTDRCCIRFLGKSLSIVHLNQSQGTTELLSIDTLSFESVEQLPFALTNYINTHDLTLTPTYWLLGPNEYQLFLLESLNVPAEEFNNALKWRIRSLINYPIETATVDSFTMPEKKPGQSGMIAAIVTKSSDLKVIIDVLKKCGVHLVSIDIPELAMRNLTAPYESDEKSTAFLYFSEQLVLLNISKEKILYFTRRLNFSSKSDDLPKEYEQLCLEILRYLDYYQSQWRHTAPSRIFVAADDGSSAEKAKALSQYMLQPVESYELKSLPSRDDTIKSLEQKQLLTIGCAMRKDAADVKTRS